MRLPHKRMDSLLDVASVVGEPHADVHVVNALASAHEDKAVPYNVHLLGPAYRLQRSVDTPIAISAHFLFSCILAVVRKLSADHPTLPFS